MSLGRDEEALESCRKAIAIKYVEAHYNAGTALRILGRYDEALKSYDRALALAPDFTEAHKNRGRVLFGLDRADEAIENFTVALRILCQEYRRFTRRYATVREMKEGPSRSAISN